MPAIREGTLKMWVSTVKNRTSAAQIGALPEAIRALAPDVKKRVMRAATLAWQHGGVIVAMRESYGWGAYSIKAAGAEEKLDTLADEGRLIGYYEAERERDIPQVAEWILEDLEYVCGAA